MSTCFADAQDSPLVDSLKTRFKNVSSDTVRLEVLYDIAWEYMGQKNDSAIVYSNKGLALAKSMKYEMGLAMGYRVLGLVFYQTADYAKALDLQQKALHIFEKNKNLPGQANALNNISNVYQALGNHLKALEFQNRSLHICQKLDFKPGIAANHGNLGNIYKNLKRPDKALASYLKALQIDEELKNEEGKATSLLNIATIYFAKKDFTEAKKYFLQSLEIRRREKLNHGIASTLNNLGNLHIETGEYDQAEKYYIEAVAYAKEVIANDLEKDAYLGLYKIARKKNEMAKALDYFEKHTAMKDSIFNSSRDEEINNIKMQYALQKQEEDLKARQKIEDAKKAHANKIERESYEKWILNIVVTSIIVLALILIFSMIIYKRYRISVKQRRIIETQKQVVEEKNKQITDSITYAKRIQEAMLPPETEFKKLFRESFLLFLPKDIVSGDFYWITQTGNKIIYATADCTGHGVPGGFMSVLGTGILNEIVNEQGITQPADILNAMREKVIVALKQTGAEGESKDGMDMVVCCVDQTNGKLTYAASNNHFYIISKGELKRLDADKMPIGYYDITRPFKQGEAQLSEGDLVYTFTDGFADQFGGEAGKKYKYENLQKLLLKVCRYPMHEQEKIIAQEFENWKADFEQTDDVCLIGVKF